MSAILEETAEQTIHRLTLERDRLAELLKLCAAEATMYRVERDEARRLLVKLRGGVLKAWRSSRPVSVEPVVTAPRPGYCASCGHYHREPRNGGLCIDCPCTEVRHE